MPSPIVILSGESNESLAASIASQLGCPLCPVILGHYPSGESRVELKYRLRGASVYIVQSDGPNPEELSIQTAMLANACHQSSARRISLILPSFPFTKVEDAAEVNEYNLSIDESDPLAAWMKQSIFPSSTFNSSNATTSIYQQIDSHQQRFDSQKVPIFRSTTSDAFKLSARLMMTRPARIENIISFCLPRPQLAGYFDAPVIDLPLHPLLKRTFASPTIMAVSDLNCSRVAGRTASILGWPYLIMHPRSADNNRNDEEDNDGEFFTAGNADLSSNLNNEILLMEEREFFSMKRCKDSVNFLKNLTNNKINLFMPHYSKDLPLQEISPYFDHIYLTNSVSIPSKVSEADNISVVDLTLTIAETIKSIEDPEAK